MTNKALSFYIVISFIFISVALLFIYFDYHWKQPRTLITVAVSKTPLSTPFYVAKAINAFDETCVDVEFDEVVGGQRAFAKVMNGEALFGTSSDSVMAFKSLENKAFVTHAMFVQSDNDVKLISRVSASINTPSNLKGKRVGVIKGTASEYFLSTLLALEGLTTEDVKLEYYKPELLIKAFTNNDVDAFVPWEPFGFQSNQQLSNEIKIHNTKSLHTLSFNLISVTADNLLVDKAKCLIQGLDIAIDYITANPEKSKQIVMNELQLSPEFIEWVWSDYIFKLALNKSLILSLNSQAVWAVATHMSEEGKVTRAQNFIDSRAMLQTTPNAVNISQ